MGHIYENDSGDDRESGISSFPEFRRTRFQEKSLETGLWTSQNGQYRVGTGKEISLRSNPIAPISCIELVKFSDPV
ncbi:hypothetical protein Ddc_13601 [Ditylenchus destructor]|nr:hypothetical protein Ddc_13601 [Ditylenchus destructor]